MPYLYESLRDSSSAANLLASWPSGPCKSIPVVYPYHVRVEPASLRLLVPPVGLSRWHRGPVFVRAGDGVGRLCDYAKGTKVKVVIEPHGGHSQDPDWLLEAMKRINRPNAGLLPDFNNFGRYNRYEGVTKSLPFAPAVCAKALNFDDKGNETNTDYFKMLKIIYESDYSGVISIEFEGHGIDPVEGSLKTKALIKKALKAAAA